MGDTSNFQSKIKKNLYLSFLSILVRDEKRDNMMDILTEIQKKTSINVYERSLRNVIGAIMSTDDFWEIVALSEEPLPLVVDIIDTLRREGYVKVNNGIVLTEKGKEFASREGIVSTDEMLCRNCSGRGISIEQFRDVLEEFNRIVKGRPMPKREFDQGFVTTDTVIARVAFMASRNDIQNKEIFVIGDDDLTSIALMLTNLPKRIAVIDIDKRLTDFIEKVSEELNYNNIDIFTFDIRDDLPDYIKKKFDTFITDPPETLYAIKAFVGRGISSLRAPGCAGYLGLTRRESSLDKWIEIEKLLVNEFGVVITDIIKNFNEYVNWGYEEMTRAWELSPVKKKPIRNWYKSYMIRILTLKNSTGFDGKIEVDEELYNDEESSTT